jgi:periplasmic copper chaperone A
MNEMNKQARLFGFQMLRALVVVATISASVLTAAHGNHTPGHGTTPTGTIKVITPFASATMPGATVGAAYMQVSNTGRSPVVLIAATSPVAAKVEFHSMSMDGNIMRMREITGGIPIPPGSTVNFVPGGMHIMLVGLTRQLTPGASIPLTLTFNGAPQAMLQMPVQAQSGGHHHH